MVLLVSLSKQRLNRKEKKVLLSVLLIANTKPAKVHKEAQNSTDLPELGTRTKLEERGKESEWTVSKSAA